MPSAATSDEARPGGEASSALLQARLLLNGSGRVPGMQDQIDWAELCLLQGLRDPGRLLFETAFIRQGFSPQCLAEQNRVARRTGLWPQAQAINAPSYTGTVDGAVAELHALARTTSRRIARSIVGRPPRDQTEPSPHASSMSQAASLDAGVGDLGQAVHALFLWLRASTLPSNWNGLETLMASLRGTIRQMPHLDHRTFTGAALPLVATALSVSALRDFLLVNSDLIVEPFGSAELFYRVARFDSACLGPYFTNVQRLVRKSRDVFELAYVGVSAAEESGVEIGLEPWLALLSRCLTGALLDEVIDDLGDAGAMSALALIYNRAASLPDDLIDLRMIRRLRDTALDNLDYDLASRAQALVVRLCPGALHERVILGTIDGSAGRITAAEQSFTTCLKLAPEFEDVRSRLIALRSRKFGPFMVQQGYEIPEDRQIPRIRRRMGK